MRFLTMRHDIVLPEDIQLLIDTFYSRVTQDEAIGYIFNDVAKVDWPEHLPKMYAFWEFLLLGSNSYRGNPIEKHMALHRLEPLQAAHFDRWIELFDATVDDLFEGPKAEEAKSRALAIATVWKPKFVYPGGIGIITEQ